jgi:hypothetical protein
MGFYDDVPVLAGFERVGDVSAYESVPGGWHVAVSDVVDSTGAIEAGQYRDVNVLGAAPIVGMRNAAGETALPYSFGGDGAAVCVPGDLAGAARSVLGDVCRIAHRTYDLSIRTAVVPVGFIREKDRDVRVARLRLSDYVAQAVFSGGGIAFAEAAMKDGRLPEAYTVDAGDGDGSINLTGLQCRWKEVPSASEETVALLVKAAEPSVYGDVVGAIHDVYGEDPTPRPISEEKLSMRLNPLGLRTESRIHTAGRGPLARLRYHVTNQLSTLVGHALMTFGIETSETDWSVYKRDLVSNADYRKFDDMLRLVIAGTREQRQELTSYLDERYERGDLAYGLHVTDRAIVTCMVSEYQHNHRHFVDASDGGYTLAARDLDRRLEGMGSVR